jgi:hypothetical protein
MFKGNPYALRGLRVPSSLRDEGVKHLDLYYAYDEGTPWHDMDEEAGYYLRDLKKDALTQEEAREHLEWVWQSNEIEGSMQATWVTLHTPSSHLIRAWCGEVATITRSTIDLLLQSNYLEIVSFAKQQENPVWDDATRDLVGSFMLDGLSLNQAQDELIRAGEKFKRALPKLPTYFYRPIGEFRAQFSEEPEYEAWWAPKKGKQKVST